MNKTLLQTLIEEDYGLREEGGQGRWFRSDKHSSLVYDSQADVFYFNAIGINGDIVVYLTKLRGMDYSKAKEYIKRFDNSGITRSFIHNITNHTETVVYPALVDAFYDNGQNLKKFEYWSKRGISKETINRFKLGYYGTDENGYYTIPFYQDGLFKNFQLRKDNPKEIRSYYRGVGRLLFNSDILKLTDKIVICEGPTDCLRLSQEGVPCISHNAGSEGWDSSWFKYFIYQKQIYVVYDADQAGEEGAKKVAKSLGVYRTKLYCFDGYEKGYDIGDWFNEGNSSKQLLDKVYDESYFVFER